MNWICGALSFLWFCPNVNLMSKADFDGHLQFFSSLDIVLSAPNQVCPEIGENLLQFKAIGHLVHDERFGEMRDQNIGQEMYIAKIQNCVNDCNCGALLTLEDKVKPNLTNEQSKVLRERQELLTNEYYGACQEKIKLNCDTGLVKEIFKNIEIEQL